VHHRNRHLTTTNFFKAPFDLGGFNIDDNAALENFDFDSFLQNPNDDGGFGMGSDFDFGHVTEVGGDL
tara:strand:+ start:29154 stop:29357 length:204 start_codon:yes stop_codon:yes gene_type:complete